VKEEKVKECAIINGAI